MTIKKGVARDSWRRTLEAIQGNTTREKLENLLMGRTRERAAEYLGCSVDSLREEMKRVGLRARDIRTIPQRKHRRFLNQACEGPNTTINPLAELKLLYSKYGPVDKVMESFRKKPVYTHKEFWERLELLGRKYGVPEVR